MSEQFLAALKLLPDYLAEHVVLSAAALALGILIGLPLAVVAARRPAWRGPLLLVASLIQTIPGLALLALFYPLLLAISNGFLPSLLALTLYAVLPILRNGVTGLVGLDPAVIEAAKGVGMSPRQQLLYVEAPLAAPVIMAGLRTSAVWTIGAATLATPVGQTSLGNYIFSGLQLENWVFVLFGCAAAAALAFATDLLLGLVEAGTAKREVRMILAGFLGLVIGTGAAFASLQGGGATGYVIGAKNFSEQFILAELISDRLRSTGAPTRMREGLGSAIAFRALAANDLDVYVDYSGTLWANVLGRKDTPGREELLRDLKDALARDKGVTSLGSLGFENAYGLVMRRGRAAELGIRTIDDLARHASQLSFGADLEFLHRPEWEALSKAYSLNFEKSTSYDPTFMYRALASGDVDVISGFTSDGRIAADDLVVLGDPRQALPSYDAVVLVSPRRAGDKRLLDALRPLIGRINVEAMRRANLEVDRDRDKVTPARAANDLAKAVGLQ
jgi:osmoprotectant transport system permease protein